MICNELVEWPFPLLPNTDILNGPINLGYCEENGAPVGIYPDDVHFLVCAASGKGKTTLFRNLIRQESIVEIKLFTNKLENESRQGVNRLINIDPGYISLERLVLATGKNYTHRIYLSKGIYADLTLVFNRGSFRPLEWSYRDYSDPATIELLNREREDYKLQLRGILN